MNLIEGAWIPVRRKDGSVEQIAPWQITEGKGIEFLELAAPRPDFNGALIQFLIGLLQTTCAPTNKKSWRDWLREPPSPNDLKKRFLDISYAFELDGNGSRFMQELTVDEVSNSKISALLMDTPGENTIRRNADHFVKRDFVEALCGSCAASALLTMQINAPTGGAGHLTGIRGGGPLTTLVIANSLWTDCWLNVLNLREFIALADSSKSSDEYRFPWLANNSTKSKGITTPADVHPDQIFWAMPRRVRLNFEDVSHPCDLCGKQTAPIVKSYWTKPHGIDYGDSGIWRHPLSPYTYFSTQQATAVHPKADGISYRHWLGLVQTSSGKNAQRQPAATIQNYIVKQEQERSLRIWSFGYEMEKMSTRCWHDSTMPLVIADTSIREIFENHVTNMVLCAQAVAMKTSASIKEVWFDGPGNTKGDLSFINARFYLETESSFFENLSNLRKLLEDQADGRPILEKWRVELAKKAEKLFDNLSQSGEFEAVDPKRIAITWRKLHKYIWGNKVREQLGLPK